MFDFSTRIPRISLPRLLSRFVARREGSVAIEFGMIAVPFFLIMAATVQTAIVYMAQQQLETVTEQASRYILTNQAATQTQSQFASTVCAQVSALFSCSGLMVDVETAASFSSANTSAPTLTFNSSGQVTNTWQFTPGNPGDIVVVRVMYQWPIFLKPFGFNLTNLSNGNRLLIATAVFRNEPL
ncbi:MAG: TadE/TadG family type IV pilus assembly protein [Methylovirgula sp.]